MNNNKESDGNSITDKRNIELNDLYNRYFPYPENIDSVYNKPQDRPYISGFIGGFIYDANNVYMHHIEKIIRQIYYRLPSLSFPGFFDVHSIRPDLKEGRKQEIKEIYDAAKMMLSDIDNIKNIDTKKRILYYFKTLAYATRGCEISKNISVLVANAERKNSINTSNIVGQIVNEHIKENLTK